MHASIVFLLDQSWWTINLYVMAGWVCDKSEFPWDSKEYEVEHVKVKTQFATYYQNVCFHCQSIFVITGPEDERSDRTFRHWPEDRPNEVKHERVLHFSTSCHWRDLPKPMRALIVTRWHPNLSGSARVLTSCGSDSSNQFCVHHRRCLDWIVFAAELSLGTRSLKVHWHEPSADSVHV